MEKNEEPKKIKISLWLFYVLAASIVILIATTIIGWMTVIKQNKEIEQKQATPSTAMVRIIK